VRVGRQVCPQSEEEGYANHTAKYPWGRFFHFRHHIGIGEQYQTRRTNATSRVPNKALGEDRGIRADLSFLVVDVLVFEEGL
jgi:hypothetical protein